MFTDIQDLTVLSLDAGQIVANLMVSFLCGLIITYFYRWTHKGATYQVSFVRSLILLAMITAVVMMVIGNNLARAFGLVGAMSIIRFRTALKDTQDIVFVFFSLTIGLAAGVGYRQLALLSTIVIGLTILLLARTNFASINRRDLVLHFTYQSTDGGAPAYEAIFDKYTKRHKLLSSKVRNRDKATELVYEVDLKSKVQTPILTRALAGAEGVENVNAFTDEDPDV